MSSVYISSHLKSRLIQAARRRGFVVERGRQSKLAEYIAYLVALDEQTESNHPPQTLGRALGLLASEGLAPPTDEDVQLILNERRLKH